MDPLTRKAARPMLDSPLSVHIVGIGGAGTSALAQYLRATGHTVTGSDIGDSVTLHRLAAAGIQVSLGHRNTNLPDAVDLVVRTRAVDGTNAELFEATRRGIPVVTYGEAVGALTRRLRTLAVAGTHGKSTTTAMLGLALIAGGLDPTVIVGATVEAFGNSNFRFGSGPHLVLEACEFEGTFLDYTPEIAIVLNIEHDHIDCYPSEESYVAAFRHFVAGVADGCVLFDSSDPNAAALRDEWGGRSGALTFSVDGFTFDAHAFPYPKLLIGGDHNRRNASFAIAAALRCGVSERDAREALEGFSGIGRRFEPRGVLPSGARWFDDYAHHPTEVAATIAMAREIAPTSRLVCVFQPHQRGRLLHFLEAFSHALKGADMVLVSDVFAARESAVDETRSAEHDLVDRIVQNGGRAEHVSELQNVAAWLLTSTSPHDVVVTMGAGDLHSIGDLFEDGGA